MNTRGSMPHRAVRRLAWNGKTSAGLVVAPMWSITMRNLRGITVLGMLLGIMMSSGCGGGVDEAGTAGGSAVSTTRQLAAAPTPDPATPGGVAVVALREIYRWEPVTEVPGASLERAREWLGPALLRVLEATSVAADAPEPSLRWGDWATSGARVEAFAFASGDGPPAGPDPDVRQFKIGIEQTVVYPDGRAEPLAPSTVIATVVRTPEGWRLDGYR